MLFNSVEFFAFFAIVLLSFFFLRQKQQVYFLLIASYFFYAGWKPKYLTLLIISSVVDYFASHLIYQAKDPKRKRMFLWISLISNLGFLFTFKYLGFFSSIYNDLVASGFQISPKKLVLPVGISFYTFQSIGYIVDVYRGRHAPAKSLPVFALFVSFFPQLVAGPIERSGNLLDQFNTKKVFNYNRFANGAILMFWGLFQKSAIADHVASYVEKVYADPSGWGGFNSAIATILFGFQIYCDFGGYTNMAIGCSEILGFSLMKNFNAPYLATSITDFWRRWHISLSTWFKDYLYIPLGGNKVSFFKQCRNLFIVFLVSGLWHGANWTFVAWGAFHGLIIVFEKCWNQFCRFQIKRTSLKWLITMIAVFFSWIFFRAQDMKVASSVIKQIITWPTSDKLIMTPHEALTVSFLISVLMIVDFLGSYKHLSRQTIRELPIYSRWLLYLLMPVGLLIFGKWTGDSFIYFQF